MSLKKIKLTWVLIALISFSFGQSGKKSYTDADAVYLSLTKTFVLNKDGSMTTTVDKRQKLLTHRAFQSVYGETRITYNPQFQKVVVQKAFTENLQHQKIETPQNGYNDILPGYSNLPKVFSHLREMVVTHTGLEQGAIINCLFETKTEAGKIPWLMGDELLQMECPVEKLTILVKVPAGTPLYFKSLNSSILPKIEKGREFDSYSWQYFDVPQRNREWHASPYGDQPRLFFSTETDHLTTLKWLTDQDAFKVRSIDALKKNLDQKIAAATSTLQKALKIQDIVVRELNNTPIPPALLAFRIRTPEQVWQSNTGTALEKCCLLAALLRTEGMEAEVCMVLPTVCREERMTGLISGEPVVSMTTVPEGVILLSADHLNTGNFELCNESQIIRSLNSDKEIAPPGDAPNKIEVTGRFTLALDDKITFELNGTFSNRFNSYYDLLRNGGVASNLLPGFSGRTVTATPTQSEIKFGSEKGMAVESRGKFKFVDLPECENGLSSLHLNPLPYQRVSGLDLGSALSETYHFSFLLPGGYHLANPIDFVSAKSDIGSLTLNIRQKDSLVEVTKTLSLNKQFVSKEEYGYFREMIDKWYTPKFKRLLLVTE